MEYVAVFEIVRDAGFHFPTRNVGGERIRTDLAETGKETLERTL
jgi:hypothetical protein